jgi:D-alanyl-lipoteichoic acid acyltransferase DltB (MBOAT superfamily)
MSAQTLSAVELVGYVGLARVMMQWLRGRTREFSFAALNLVALYLCFFKGPENDTRSIPTFVTYVGVVVFQYVMLRLFAGRKGLLPWIAFLTPILFLVAVRYTPPPWYAGARMPYGALFVGISYLAFRSSYLVIEIRNGTVPAPGFWQYLGFCFFLPTIAVGPISAYGNHYQAFTSNPPQIPPGRAALRILVGIVKYRFLGSIFAQLNYSNLLCDDHYHHWIDLFVAIVFYYLYLYFNFSGFCDVAIGAAGLIGIPVAENFNSPLAARNLGDYWNRWHITLSHYMRDVVFSPLSKFLVRVMGPAKINYVISITITVVFLLIGIWHGAGWHFAAFGAVHASGLVVNHYYTIFLKNRLGREGFKAYNANPWIRAVAVGLTFCYCAVALLFFANTFPELKQMFSILK